MIDTYLSVNGIKTDYYHELNANYTDEYSRGFQTALRAVVMRETAKVVLQKQASWILREGNNAGIADCSSCYYRSKITPFCPYCGAEMTNWREGGTAIIARENNTTAVYA